MMNMIECQLFIVIEYEDTFLIVTNVINQTLSSEIYCLLCYNPLGHPQDNDHCALHDTSHATIDSVDL